MWPRPVVFVALLALLAGTACGTASAASVEESPDEVAFLDESWANGEIETVVNQGIMVGPVEEFRPSDPLTWAELAQAVAAAGGVAPVVADPARFVRLRELDGALVRLLGLAPAARQVRVALGAAGLEPPARVGTETIARLVGLRINHPMDQDQLERAPDDSATRAEAAYSLARVLELRATDLSWVAERVSSFAVPQLSDWQRRILARAVALVGFPYVWGGSSETAQAPFGVTVPGGFDCSGFTWRVYKLQDFDGDWTLADTLKGRSTYELSAEVKRPARIPIEQVQPADLLFFGERGRKSKPRQVGHMGISLGNGWMVHSSRYGTTITPIEGWYLTDFAWARRPLAEAGLA